MDIVLKSLAGGAIIGLVLLSSKLFGEKVGGIVAAIPLVFMLSYLFVLSEQEGTANNFIFGGIFSGISFILFTIVLYFLNKQFSEQVFLNIAIAYLFWLALTVFWILILKK